MLLLCCFTCRFIGHYAQAYPYADDLEIIANLNIQRWVLFTRYNHKLFYSNNISRQSPVSTRCPYFNFPLPLSISAAGHRRIEFQVAKLQNSLPIHLRAIFGPMEFGRELRHHPLGWVADVLSG